MIDLHPDDEQQLVIDTVREFAREQIRPRAREAEEEARLPAEVIEQAHRLDLIAGTLPESYGGTGTRSAVTQVLIAEELAWADLAIALAILSPGLLAFPLLDEGSPEQHAQHLPKLAGNEFVPGSLALIEPRFDSDPFRPRTRAVSDGAGWRLEGDKAMLPWLDGLVTIAVVAELDGAAQLFLVDREAPGLSARPAAYMGVAALPLVELELRNVRVDASARLGGPDSTAARRVVERGRVGLGALGVGLARAAFELARDYAKQRETFGAPIATRQSIAFLLADMATEIDGLRLLVWEAAWRLDHRLDVRRESALVIQQTRRVVLQVADAAVQIYGGHGYVREYLPELLLRNAAGFASFEALTLV